MSDAALVARLLEHARLHEMLHCSSPHHAQQAKWAADLREAARLLVQDADMVAAERERCAKLCDSRAESTTVDDVDMMVWMAAAKLIRGL